MSKNKASLATQLSTIRPRVQQTNHTSMQLRTFGNNLRPLHKLEADGADHINIDYKASTQLGSLLAETSPVNFVHPTYGPFATLIGFWHWLRDENRNDQYRNLRSRDVFELTRNSSSVKNNHVENMIYEIVVANYYRVVGNKKIYEWVKKSELPFDMYYFYQNGRNMMPIRKDFANWFVASMEEIRYALQNNTEPNFNDFLDNPDAGIQEYQIVSNYSGPAFSGKKAEAKQPKEQTKVKHHLTKDKTIEVDPSENVNAEAKPFEHKRTPEEQAIWKAAKEARRAAKKEQAFDALKTQAIADVFPEAVTIENTGTIIFNTTSLIPVHTELSKECFTDTSIIEPIDYVLNGVAFKTAPLNPNKVINLLGVSTHEELLNKEIIDNSDNIDPSINISNLYFLIIKDTKKYVLCFVIKNNPSAYYVYKQLDNYRELEVNYYSNLLVDESTTDCSGNQITELLKCNDKDAFIINVSIKGSINIKTGEAKITHVDTIYNKSNSDVRFVGYDLKCSRVNVKRNVITQDVVLQDNGTIVIEKPLEEPIVTTGEGNAIEEGPTATAYIPQVTSNTMEPAQSLDTAVQQESTQATNEVSTATVQ